LTPTDTGLPAEVTAGTEGLDLHAQLRRIRTLRLAPTYVAAVVALRVTLCVAACAAFRTALVQDASTNVVNLTHGRFGTLLTSAFVLEGRACLPALLALGAVLGIAELAWGGLVLAAVFVYGHVVATLLVFAGLVTGLQLHRLCESLAAATDVGPSYGGVTVLGALLAASRLSHARRWRVAAIVVALAAVLVDRAFTDVEHVLALLLEFAIGDLERWRRGVRRGADRQVVAAR
jgi:hypothetical protein